MIGREFETADTRRLLLQVRYHTANGLRRVGQIEPKRSLQVPPSAQGSKAQRMITKPRSEAWQPGAEVLGHCIPPSLPRRFRLVSFPCELFGATAAIKSAVRIARNRFAGDWT